jgi:hypothetical protein
MGAIKVRAQSTKGHDLASPEPNLGQGQPTPEDSRLTRGPLKQRTRLRLARGPVFAKKQPWPDRHTDRPYRRSI